PIDSAVFSPDGKRILAKGFFGGGAVWNAADGKMIRDLYEDDGITPIFSPDGKRMFTTIWVVDEKTAKISAKVWDTDSGKMLFSLEGNKMAPAAALFSPDGKRIVTMNQDGSTNIWDADSGKMLLSIDGVLSYSYAGFSPDGARIVAAASD